MNTIKFLLIMRPLIAFAFVGCCFLVPMWLLIPPTSEWVALGFAVTAFGLGKLLFRVDRILRPAPAE